MHPYDTYQHNPHTGLLVVVLRLQARAETASASVKQTLAAAAGKDPAAARELEAQLMKPLQDKIAALKAAQADGTTSSAAGTHRGSAAALARGSFTHTRPCNTRLADHACSLARLATQGWRVNSPVWLPLPPSCVPRAAQAWLLCWRSCRRR